MNKDADSITHHAERSAQMREESKSNARQQAQADTQQELRRAENREQSIQAQEKQVNDIIPPGATREQLLDRIRQMREEKTEVVPAYYMSPAQEEQLRLEQEEGRRQVALAEAEAKRLADLRMKTEAVATGQGEMVPVHHPNPAQDEQYPAIKATLGKPSTPPPAPVKQLK